MKTFKLFYALAFILSIANVQSQNFEDKPGNEPDGNFPSKWDLIKGSAQIMTFGGEKVINFAHNSIITPSLQSKNYLSDNFTLEFELYFDKLEKPIYYYQYYNIRFWDGNAGSDKQPALESISYEPLQIQRHGVRFVGYKSNRQVIKNEIFKKNLEGMEPIWKLITINYNNGALKVSIDDTQILNIPQINYKPSMVSIGSIYNLSDNGFTRGIKNVQLNGISIDNNTAQTTSNNTNANNNITNTTSTTPIGFAYTLPIKDGSSNQILQTDGNGTVTWVDLPLLTFEPHTHENTIGGNTNSDTTNTFSGLEAIDEGNGIGWRLKGRDPNNYGNIGLNAVDFSFSDDNFERDYGPHSGKGATGESSFAMGFRALASGDYSTSIGYWPSSIGNGSIAMGYEPVANDSSSIALGYKTNATRKFAVAIGSKANANRDYSIAIGHEVTADESYATAIGYKSQALGKYSVAMGNDNKAKGDYSIAMGTNANANGKFSTAIGKSSQAQGDFSLALGNSAVAWGDNTFAVGQSSHAMGNSTAIGDHVRAEGNNSLALGSDTKAIGTSSTAMGNSTNASGYASTAIGFHTSANGLASTAIGRYNIGHGEPENWKDIDPLFEIGNGRADDNRSNAITVLKNGNMGISTPTPQVKLHITNGTDASLSSGGFMIIGDKQGENLVFDNNELMARKNVQPATLYLQQNGGDVFVGGKVVHSSDKRLKQDIVNLSYGISEIMQLRPVSYHWKSNPEASQKSIGLIAQEVQPILKELVTINTNNENTLGVNYTELIPILIKALQEQQEIIQNQNRKIENLTVRLNDKEEAINTIIQRMELIESTLNNDKL